MKQLFSNLNLFVKNYFEITGLIHQKMVNHLLFIIILKTPQLILGFSL